MSANAAEDYIEMRNRQFNSISNMAYTIIILAMIGGVLFVLFT